MLEDVSYHIAVLYVSIHIPAAQSLKDKRMVLKSLKEKIRSKFNVSVAELDGHDKWQVSTLGMVMIGNDNRFLDSAAQSILSFMKSFHTFQICSQKFELR